MITTKANQAPLVLTGGTTTTTKPKRRAPSGTGTITSVGELQAVMQTSLMLKQFAPRSVCYVVAGGRPVLKDIAENAIRWGLVAPINADLFGDPANALVFELKGSSR